MRMDGKFKQATGYSRINLRSGSEKDKRRIDKAKERAMTTGETTTFNAKGTTKQRVGPIGAVTKTAKRGDIIKVTPTSTTTKKTSYGDAKRADVSYSPSKPSNVKLGGVERKYVPGDIQGTKRFDRPTDEKLIKDLKESPTKGSKRMAAQKGGSVAYEGTNRRGQTKLEYAGRYETKQAPRSGGSSAQMKVRTLPIEKKVDKKTEKGANVAVTATGKRKDSYQYGRVPWLRKDLPIPNAPDGTTITRKGEKIKAKSGGKGKVKPTKYTIKVSK
jgi:hypothetical protein